MEYSIVIPVHNEAEHIAPFLDGFLERLPAHAAGLMKEIILVENGSTDGSLDACHELEKSRPGLVRSLTNSQASYGEAIKTGILAASGTHLSILECDFLDESFVLASIERFEAGESRFVVASKRHPDSVDHRPWERRLLTEGFNRILNLLLGYPGSDTHGLKSIETDLAQRLCELSQTTHEVFQTEIVLIAWTNGVRIDELPIRIEERRRTPVSILRRVPMVISLVAQLRGSIRRFEQQPVKI